MFNKDKTKNVRFTKKEEKLIDDVSEMKGLRPSPYIRIAALNQARRDRRYAKKNGETLSNS